MKASHTIAQVVALAFLVSCGGSQPPMPQNVSLQARQSGKSWMLPEAKNEDLLYASDTETQLYVFSYPGLKLVGNISLPNSTNGLCSDSKGNIFVPQFGNISEATSEVYEYSHGGTQPIQTLSDPGYGNGCAVDPMSGNLAVANDFGNLGSYDHGSLAVYQGATGTPSVYYTPTIYWYEWVAYDSKGNLFVDGYNDGGAYPLAELSRGSGTLSNVTLDQEFEPLSLQWDKGNLVIASFAGRSGPETIYRVAMSGSTGSIVGTTQLTNRRNKTFGNGQYWIQGKTIIGADFPVQKIGFWRYPEGGRARKVLQADNGHWWGVAVSLAPSHARTRR